VSLLLLLLPAIAQQRSPTELASEAKRLEKQGKVVEAYLLYTQAAAADPDAKRYWLKAQALRRRAVMAANVMPKYVDSPDVPDAEAAEDISETAPPPTAKELETARQPQPPPILEATPGLKTFSVTADSKSLWEQVTKAFGLEPIFDGDFRSTPNIRFRMEDVDYRDAMYALQHATGTFIVPITGKIVLVVNDTPMKRFEQELDVTVLIPIPDPVTAQDAQDLARSVQQLMEIQRFGFDAAHRVVFFRDRASKVRPAQEVILQLLTRRPEVMLEIELLAVSKNSTLTYGIPLPTSVQISTAKATVTPLSKVFQYLTHVPAWWVSVGVLSTELLATVDKSTVETLFHTELRAEDAFPAQFHIGDKYPIVTAVYTGDTSASRTLLATPPVFNFEDLGLKLKVTPKIHGTDEVTLEIEAEFRVLSGAAVNQIPVISSRNVKDTARLKFGEWAAIAGLVTTQEARSLSGIAGLSQIPILGPLLSKNIKQDTDTQMLLVVKPHLLSNPSTEYLTRPIYLGPEGRMRIPI
jgi:hypothetical protein